MNLNLTTLVSIFLMQEMYISLCVELLYSQEHSKLNLCTPDRRAWSTIFEQIVFIFFENFMKTYLDFLLKKKPL